MIHIQPIVKENDEKHFLLAYSLYEYVTTYENAKMV